MAKNPKAGRPGKNGRLTPQSIRATAGQVRDTLQQAMVRGPAQITPPPKPKRAVRKSALASERPASGPTHLPEPPHIVSTPPSTVLRALAEMATALWRIGRRVCSETDPVAAATLRPMLRMAEIGLERAKRYGVDVVDRTGQEHRQGDPVSVRDWTQHSEPGPDRVVTTYLPSVYLGDQQLQRGEVQVAYYAEPGAEPRQSEPPSSTGGVYEQQPNIE